MSTKKMKKDDLADAFLQGFYFARMYLKGEIQEQPKAVEKPKPKKKVRAINLDEPLVLATEAQEPKSLDLDAPPNEKKPKKPKTLKKSELQATEEPVLDGANKDETKEAVEAKPKAEKKRKRAE